MGFFRGVNLIEMYEVIPMHVLLLIQPKIK